MTREKIEREHLYLDEHGLAEPLLLLTLRHPGRYRPTDARSWYAIRHQCAGHACRQRDLFGTPLTPRGAIAMGLAQLANRWEWSDCGMWGLALDEVERYRAELRALGLDCNQSFAELLEGYYPIDLPERLSELVEDELPEDLDELIAWEHPAGSRHGALERAFGSLNRFGLVLLGPNCD